jgi:hypothetical protein
MMTNEELNLDLGHIEAWTAHESKIQLMGSIAKSLLRIAHAQEQIVEMSTMDMETHIAAVIEERSKIKAEDIVKEQTSRSFIGKR